MTDFSAKTAVTGERQDTRWRAGRHGQNEARPGQLQGIGFTSLAVNGIIPSGIAVQASGDGKYLPYDGNEASVLAGYINDEGGVELAVAPTFSLLVHGIIKASVLPVPEQRATVKTAKTSGSFIYVED